MVWGVWAKGRHTHHGCHSRTCVDVTCYLILPCLFCFAQLSSDGFTQASVALPNFAPSVFESPRDEDV